jgi:TPR repeat protein
VSRNDNKEALRWYRAAAEQGLAEAQERLGSMYAGGWGVLQDYTEAVQWYRASAEQGNDEGLLDLGEMYASGQGVPQDYIQAHMWFNLAGASGNAVAGLAIKERDSIAGNMTSEQISEAQRLAREWKPKRNK